MVGESWDVYIKMVLIEKHRVGSCMKIQGAPPPPPSPSAGRHSCILALQKIPHSLTVDGCQLFTYQFVLVLSILGHQAYFVKPVIF